MKPVAIEEVKLSKVVSCLRKSWEISLYSYFHMYAKGKKMAKELRIFPSFCLKSFILDPEGNAGCTVSFKVIKGSFAKELIIFTVESFQFSMVKDLYFSS